MTRYKGFLAPIRAYALDCWIKDEPATLNGAARACDELRLSGGRETYSTPIRTAYEHLASRGILLVEERGEGERGPWIIRGFNYTNRPPQGQTLRDALEPFLSDMSVSAAKRQLTKEAVRAVLEGLVSVNVSGTRGDDPLLLAASHLPAERIRELPARAASLPTSKGREYARAIRNLMRHAAENGTVVMHTRPLREASAWQESVEKALPIGGDEGATLANISRRGYLLRLGAALEETLRSPPERLEDASPSDVKRALEHMETTEGDARPPREIRAILIDLGEGGVGPYQRLAKCERYVTRLTSRHYGPAYTLLPADGVCMESSWDNLCHTLESHGLSEQDVEFVRFMEDYTDLDGEELERKYGHQLIRPIIRQLRGMSRNARIRSLRAYYGIALLDRGWKVEDVILSNVFGHRFHELTRRLRALWDARADQAEQLAEEDIPTRGFTASRNAPTLERQIINGGLIALTAFEWSRWKRDLSGVSPRKDGNGEEAPIKLDAVELAALNELTPDEKAWVSAYRYANVKADEIARARGRVKSGPTHRNVEAIVNDTPSIALVQGYLEELQVKVRADPRNRRTMVDAVHAFAWGIIATGGSRVGELPKVKLGIHLDAAERRRYITLNGNLRKVLVDHVLVILEQLVPDWLYDYVIDVARPALVRTWMNKTGSVTDHGFLLVRASGAPYADPHWTPESRTLNPQRLANASSQLLGRFAGWRRKRLLAKGLPIVVGRWGHHTTHATRHQIATAGTQLGFTNEQLSRLLGHKGKSMVGIAYTPSVARELAQMVSEILRHRPWEGGYAVVPRSTDDASGRVVEATHEAEHDAALVTAFHVLKRRVDMGDISGKELLAKVAELDFTTDAG